MSRSFKNRRSPPSLPFPDIATSELFMRFTRSNKPLSESEALVFEDHTLSAAEANLSAVDSHIGNLQAQWAAAVAERGRCKQLVDECWGVLSPLRELPLEVLTEIFRWYCMMSENIVDIGQGPWLLSHVCSLWRRVVISTPSLWIYISICSSFLHGRACPSRSGALLRAALSRSKNLLLRIDFRKDVNRGNTMSPPRNNHWLDIVMGVSERWQHCYFYFLHDAEDEIRLGAVKGRVNQLETLRIQFSRGNGAEVLEVVDAFQLAPKLWSVELYEVNGHKFELPVAQLTRVREYWDDIEQYQIDVPQQPLDSLQRYIAQCPALHDLHIAHPFAFDRYPGDYNDASLISHTLLRSLTISDQYLLDILNLPSLEELNIKTRYAPMSRWWGRHERRSCPEGIYHSVLKLIQRSGCSMKCLKVTDARSDVLCDILQLTPALEELKLRYNHFQRSSVFYLLISLDFRQKLHLLPRLQTLSLYLRPTVTDDGAKLPVSQLWQKLNGSLLSAMIESRRMRPGGPYIESRSEQSLLELQNLRIVSDDFIQTPDSGECMKPMEESLKMLRERKAGGMNISVIALYNTEVPGGMITQTKAVYV